MSLMASSKRMRNARGAFVKAALHSVFVAGVGLCLGIGAGTAAATPLQQAVGPLTFDFLYPNITTDQNLGMFAFPDTGQTVKVPFGVGVKGSNASNGFIFTFPVNPFEIDVTPTSIAVEYTASGGVPPLQFPNNEQAIIKMTTTQSSLINLVSLESQTGITLTPGAFLFGSNFFQVNLADASIIQPGASSPGQAWISQRATTFQRRPLRNRRRCRCLLPVSWLLP
jgi:hypothetical protein